MRNRWIIALVASGLVLGTLVPILLSIGRTETADDSGYSLKYSISPNWSDPLDLDGATVSGKIYAFVSPEVGIDDVEFYLDDEHTWTEDNPPFDFAGGDRRRANPWNTTDVEDGEHTIRADLRMNDGSTVTVEATFTVANNAPSPGSQNPPANQEPPANNDAAFSLLYSTSSNRSNPVNLDGATVSGNIYPFTTPDDGVDDVDFFLDGVAVWTEDHPPFDFKSGSESAANPWDTSQVSDGQHTIRAILHLFDGSTVEVNATFTVANGGNPPSSPPDENRPEPPDEAVPNPPGEDGRTSGNSQYVILYSTSSNWSNPVNLDGATVSGSIYPFTSPDVNVDDVEFFLDGQRVRRESNPPFDFGGGSASRANPWNTSKIDDGEHTITAILHMEDGGTTTISATFIVDNVKDESNPNARPPAQDGAALQYSTSANRSNPSDLDGATVSGDVYVFVEPDTEVSQVNFYLDNQHVQRENQPPYDFAGTAVPASNAHPWDTTTVSNGQHTITAILNLTNGTTSSFTATFTVENAEDGQNSPSEGEPAPDEDPIPPPDENPNTGDLQLIPTYHSVSVYTSYSGSAETVAVEYRVAGGAWVQGHPLLVVGGEARGSLVGLQPATTYEVRVGNKTGTVTTWSEQYPVGSGKTYYVDDSGNDSNPGTEAAPFRTINKATSVVSPGDTVLVRSGTYAPFEITRSGTANAYIDIRAYPGERPVVSLSGSGTLVTIAAKYVRVQGFELSGGNNGVKVNTPSQFVVIDGLLIHNLIHTGDTAGPVTIGDSFNSQNSVANITVQNNEIHAPPADPAQSAVYVKGSSGGHVIRYNRVYFHHDGWMGHGTDCFGGGPNKQKHGGFHRDTDVYGNYCEGATDDAISADGGGMNVRIWDNVAVRTQTGISVAPVLLGPTYYFRNVTYNQEVHWIDKCMGVKTGEDSPGTVYLYHNVWVSTDPAPCDGKIHGFSNDGGGSAGTIYARNNIVHVTARIYSGGNIRGDHNLHFSEKSGKYGSPLYDCCGSSAGSLSEFQADTNREQGSLWGRPSYASASGHSFGLAAGSIGVDSGVVIAGFNSPGSRWAYKGSAPDMGAAER